MLKLSRSAVELSLNCKRCFILQYKHRVSLRNLPFTLNSAVDNLCKNEFDFYRKNKKPHPLFLENGGVTDYLIDAVPFQHEDLDKWRNFRQDNFTDEYHGFTFYGAIDDVWIKKTEILLFRTLKVLLRKNLIGQKPGMSTIIQKAYKRQLEMYQWLFKKNGFRYQTKHI